MSQQLVLGFCKGGIGYQDALQITNPDPRLAKILEDVNLIVTNLENKDHEMNDICEPFLKWLPPDLSLAELIYEMVCGEFLNSQVIERMKGTSKNGRIYKILDDMSIGCSKMSNFKLFDLNVQKVAIKMVSDELNRINTIATQAFNTLKAKIKTNQNEKDTALQEYIEALNIAQTQLNEIKEKGFGPFYDKAFENLKDSMKINVFKMNNQKSSNDEILNELINPHQKYINSLIESLQLFKDI